jgi:hypothetical protein
VVWRPIPSEPVMTMLALIDLYVTAGFVELKLRRDGRRALSGTNGLRVAHSLSMAKPKGETFAMISKFIFKGLDTST